MQKLFTLILWSVIINSAAISVQAQDNSGCFMLDADGKPMDLGYLCQNTNTPKPNHSNIAIPQRVENHGVHTIPIKGRRSGIPIIDVKFNDRYIFEMMLDTGASSIVITPKMARILKVNHHETILVSTPSDNRVKLSSGYVYSIQVAGLKQKNARVITAPSMDMGLLGQSFFSQYDLTIKRNVIEFRER